LDISTIQAILLVGLITIIYDVLGGIRIVILSDFFQMVIIVVGILICGGIALQLTGWEFAWQNFDPERLKIFDMKHFGFTSEGRYAFWPMLFGGFFLYISYYGCDQSQVQRELSVGTVNDVRKSLLVNAFGRFPLVLLYSIMGVLIGAVFAIPELSGQIAERMNVNAAEVPTLLAKDPDRMVPVFILSFLPHGLIGFLFVAIMAALMSSLDSGINSLSAVTMKDFYQKYIGVNKTETHYLAASKLITLLWGIFCITAAIILDITGEATRQTSIVLINAVGSILYGPILAAFIIGFFSKRIGAFSIKAGIISGVLINLILWLSTPISWLWWNVTGFLTVLIIAVSTEVISPGTKHVQEPELGLSDLTRHLTGTWGRIYGVVVVYFFLILTAAYLLERHGY
jgi:Na+/proline symporter